MINPGCQLQPASPPPSNPVAFADRSSSCSPEHHHINRQQVGSVSDRAGEVRSGAASAGIDPDAATTPIVYWCHRRHRRYVGCLRSGG
jgi:hypothetical protein